MRSSILALLLAVGCACPLSAQSDRFSQDEVKLLAASFCSSIEMNYGSDGAAEILGDLLQNALVDAYPEQSFDAGLQRFWSEHGGEMLCRSASALKSHIRAPQALLKRIVDMNMEGQLLNGVLLKNVDYPIDVNVVEDVDGRPETLLDHLNAIILDESRHSNYSFNEIIRLRLHLIRNFDAKTAGQLGHDVPQWQRDAASEAEAMFGH